MTDSSPAPEIDELLAEEDFVRRLARGLLFDAHRVDDLVQQTWLAALTHPPQERAASRRWLQRVVRNLALNQIRGESRRRRREREVVRPEELPSVQEVLEREALRKRVVQAMLALSEPYRIAIMLRYFEDQTPKQIAQRLGVPAGTVRARLSRGLDLMRQRLDRACGDRHGWALPLIPLASAGRAARRSAALIPALLGLAGSLLLVAVGLWMLGPADGLPPVGTPVAGNASPGTAADRSSPGARTGTAAGTSARQPLVTEPVPAARSGFRGRLLTASGLPAAGEVLRIFGVDGLTVFLEGSGNRVLGAEAQTGVDGRFQVEGLEPGALYLMHAGAGGPHASLHQVPHTPGPGEIVDLGDVSLQARGSVEGRVVDPEGDAVSGAVVWAADLPAMVLAAVPIDRLSPEHGAILWLPTPNEAELAGDGDFPARLEKFLGADMLRKSGLEDRPDTAALVVDAPAWVHRLYDWLPVARSTTAADGSFLLAGVAPGSNVVVARHPGFATGQRQVMVRVDETRDAGTLRLPAGETASGSVVDHDRPVRGAEVRVAALGVAGLVGLAFCEAPVSTDSRGRFEVQGLPRGAMLVAVRRDPAEPWTVRGPLAVDEDVVIELPGAESFVLELGAAVPDLELALFEGPSLGELRHAGLQRRLPLGGRLHAIAADRYRIDGLLPGAYALRLRSPGHVPEETVFTIPRETPLRLSLRAASPVIVHVRDGRGAPVAGARIFAQEVSPPPWARPILPTSYGLPSWSSLPHDAGITDEDGSLAIDVLPAGPVRFGAFHPGLGRIDEEVSLPTTDVSLVLPGTGGVRGQLYDKGRPAERGAWQLSFTYDGASEGSMPRSPAFVATGVEGTFGIEGLSAGTYVVEPRQADGVTSLAGLVDLVKEKVSPFAFDFGSKPTSARVEVRAGEVADLRFDLDPSWPAPGEPGGTITGVVRLDEVPAPGLQVCRVDVFDQAVLTTTDGNGSFRLEGVAAGMLTLALRDPEQQGTLWMRRVQVERGAAVDLEVEIHTGTLEGHAWRSDGRPAAGLRVLATGSAENGNARFETKTDARGGFRFTRLPAGNYEVLIEGNGVRGRSEEASLTAGSHPTLLVQLVELVAVEGYVRTDEPARAVSLVSEEIGLWEYGLVGEDGSFRVEGLVPGVYEITVIGTDYEPREGIPKQVSVPVSGLRGIEIR